MDAIVELFEAIPGIIGISFVAIIALYWFTDFFEFLRDLLTNNSEKVQQMEERIQRLEAQLGQQGPATLEDSGTSTSEPQLTGKQTTLSV